MTGRPPDRELQMGIAGLGGEASERRQAEGALAQSERPLRGLTLGARSGFALHEIICDHAGTPCDYRFLEVDSAFEQLVGLSADAVLGKTVLEVLPETEEYWIETYGQVALTGKATRFENYARSLGRHFEVLAYSPVRG